MCKFREIWLQISWNLADRKSAKSCVIYFTKKTQNFGSLFRSRFCADHAQNLSGPAPDNILGLPRISSESVHFRRSYSQTREHRWNAPQIVSNTSSPSNKYSTYVLIVCYNVKYSYPAIMVKLYVGLYDSCTCCDFVVVAPTATSARAWDHYILGAFYLFIFYSENFFQCLSADFSQLPPK